MPTVAQDHFFSLGYQDGLFNKVCLHGVRSKPLACAYADGYLMGCNKRLYASMTTIQSEMVRLERT